MGNGQWKRGADIYIVSVAKFGDGVTNTVNRLADIAKSYSMLVFMADFGPADEDECTGKMSVWNEKSVLIGPFNDSHEGMLMYDPDTQELIEKAP